MFCLCVTKRQNLGEYFTSIHEVESDLYEWYLHFMLHIYGNLAIYPEYSFIWFQ